MLDDENPRLPERIADRTQVGLFKWMAKQYNTLEVARSISEHGYFDSEPVIAIRAGRKLTVVEGNRRLTAVKLLLDDRLRQSLNLEDAAEWNELANAAELEDRIPVQIARNRREVAPIIGYRHIAGIEPWDPWAKAVMSRAQLYNRIQDGSINPQEDGTRTYITRGELERYVEACSSIKGAAPRRRELPGRNRAPDERA